MTNIPPVNPSGAFCSVASQSGKVLPTHTANRKQEKYLATRANREQAELLAVIGNIMQGDFDTITQVARQLRKKIIIKDIDNPDTGGESYMVRSVVEAIVKVSNNPKEV